MKTKFNLFFLLAFIFFTTNCSKDINNEVFSCDPNEDQWAHENYETLSKITGTELRKLTAEKQVVAFRTLSSSRKADIWKERFSELLLLTWSEKEKKHLTYLSDSINEKWFEINSNENKLYKLGLHSRMKDWTLYSRDSLGWSKELVFSVACRLDTPISSNNYLLESQLVAQPPSDEPSCKCSSWDDWCSGTSSCDSNKDCKETALGCGLLWMYDCDGLCGSR